MKPKSEFLTARNPLVQIKLYYFEDCLAVYQAIYEYMQTHEDATESLSKVLKNIKNRLGILERDV